ncbi:MAG: IgGFc-binding protein [Polyangiaceae bacterium]|nr:IgGFc-binding protein [Polyangiaceae bacterium]
MHRQLALVGSLVLSLASLVACEATTKIEQTGGNGPTGTGGTGGGTGGATSSQGGFGGIGIGGSAVGGSCGYSCTADLKKVIDCNGQVIQECSSDQGCANGQCINDPCEAAKQSSSSYGCDYWALKTDIISDASGACFAAFVANTWTSPVKISVERNGQMLPVANFARIPSGQGQGLQYAPYDANQGLPPGEVAILFLSRDTFGFLPDCPAPAAVAGESGVIGTGRGSAFHITTDRPVVAYQILPFGGGQSAATSATLLLPTSVWDTNYVAVNAYPASQVAPGVPSLDILAYEDGTEVTILPNNQIVGGPGVVGSPPNQAVVYSLQRGEYVQISQGAELSGSPIQSNKPVGVWGGASCLNVPVNAYYCDSAQQQIPPVKAMGNEYVSVRYRARNGQADEQPPWRIIGMVDGTALTYEPFPPPGAPSTLSLGQVFEFNASGPFIVRSQDADHPFYVAGYMTGGEAFGGEGDPEWVNVIPAAQYLDSYVLFTDPTYSETELVLVRKPSKDGQFADVVLDCAGPVQGWQPIGPYQYTRVDLVTGDFQNVGNCSNGRREIKSDLPFGVTVWGWGSTKSTLFTQHVSYAYPAGASVAKINEVVVVPDPK